MPVDLLSVTLRALSFVALFQAAGLALFLATFGRYLTVCVKSLRRMGRRVALLAAGLLVAQYLLEAGRMAGELPGVMDPSLQQLVLHSPVATTLAWRLAGLALVFVGLRETPIGGTRNVSVASLIGATLAIGAFALMGHTTTHAERRLLGILLTVHLLIVGFWFGALVPLYVASRREPASVAAAVTEEFSAIAMWLVPLLFLAGLALAVFILRSIAGLFTTYGALLITKVAGFAVLMGLAALNKWRLGPALGRGDAQIAAAFRRSLAAEYVLIAGVLSVTAVMTSFYSPE
jgi:copper resistance protein D